MSHKIKAIRFYYLSNPCQKEILSKIAKSEFLDYWSNINPPVINNIIVIQVKAL